MPWRLGDLELGQGSFCLPRLTLFGRSALLLAAELLANAICWTTTAVLFGRTPGTRPILSLALLAWTIGLRHALHLPQLGFSTQKPQDLSAIEPGIADVHIVHFVVIFRVHLGEHLMTEPPIQQLSMQTTSGTVLPHPVLPQNLAAKASLARPPGSAIDNATRSLINMGQLPVTCGLFFSLGHSTIVIVVNVAIAISTDVYDRMQTVGQVGGIVGAAVSGGFLFVVGLANSIILYRIMRKRRKIKKREAERQSRPTTVEENLEEADDGSHHNTLMMKLIGPVVTFLDRPWKMYPVGVLFGFGFDTASSIALLAISALAKRTPDGARINPADVIILPLLFTVGMTLIDSLDSIIMLYSYAGFPERSSAIFEPRHPGGHGGGSVSQSSRCDLPRVALEPDSPHAVESTAVDLEGRPEPAPEPVKKSTNNTGDEGAVVIIAEADVTPEYRRTMRAKHNAMSNLSVILTIMSIVVAFSISLIAIMGLIGEQCTPCQNAANAPDGGGLAGRWWRGWANANNNTGYIGAAIVGSFVFVVSSWYGCRFLYRKWQARRTRTTVQVE